MMNDYHVLRFFSGLNASKRDQIVKRKEWRWRMSVTILITQNDGEGNSIIGALIRKDRQLCNRAIFEIIRIGKESVRQNFTQNFQKEENMFKNGATDDTVFD